MNLLLTQTLDVKVSDFGTGTHHPTDATYTTRKKTRTKEKNVDKTFSFFFFLRGLRETMCSRRWRFFF